MKRSRALLLCAAAFAGCNSSGSGSDAGSQASSDAGLDGAMDASVMDAGEDATAESDAGTDATADAGMRDAGYHDPALVEECVRCHAPEGAAWSGHITSHRLLLFCTTCHESLDVDAGVGHATSRPCTSCHSTHGHPMGSMRCTTCHDPHGTSNIYLVREQVDVPDAGSVPIHFTRLEGASEDGLVRGGVPDASVGTGLCEVCHTSTMHYTRSGSRIAHFATPCSDCHSHELGFDRPDAG